MDITLKPKLDLRWIAHYSDGKSVVGCWNKDFAKTKEGIVRFDNLGDVKSLDVQMRDHFSHKKLTQISLRGEGVGKTRFELEFNMLAGGIKKCVYFDDNLVVDDNNGKCYKKKIQASKNDRKQRVIVPFLYGFKVKMFKDEVLQSVLTFDRYVVLYKDDNNVN